MNRMIANRFGGYMTFWNYNTDNYKPQYRRGNDYTVHCEGTFLLSLLLPVIDDIVNHGFVQYSCTTPVSTIYGVDDSL